MKRSGIIRDIKAEVASVLSWLEREIDEDGVIKKRIIEIAGGTVAILAAFVRSGKPPGATTLVVSTRFTDKEGQDVPPANKSWPFVLWFEVRPLSLGEVELEWFCSEDELLGYKDEKLTLFRQKFKVPPDVSPPQDMPSTDFQFRDVGIVDGEHLGEQRALRFKMYETVDIVAGAIQKRVEKLRSPSAGIEIDGRAVFIYGAQIQHTGPTRASRPFIYRVGEYPPPVNESMRIYIYGKNVETPDASFGTPNLIFFDLDPTRLPGPHNSAESLASTWYSHPAVIPYFNNLLVYLGNLYSDTELVDADGRLVGGKLIDHYKPPMLEGGNRTVVIPQQPDMSPSSNDLSKILRQEGRDAAIRAGVEALMSDDAIGDQLHLHRSTIAKRRKELHIDPVFLPGYGPGRRKE